VKLPPWERTGSTARQRLTELIEVSEANGAHIISGYYGHAMQSTGGTAYPVPLTDLRAVLDELAAAETRVCRCCTDNECDCVHPDAAERQAT
jgi:hypothetical protein